MNAQRFQYKHSLKPTILAQRIRAAYNLRPLPAIAFVTIGGKTLGILV